MQHELYPSLRPLPPIDENKPEHTVLLLPSAYTPHQRWLYGLTEATKVELELRLGHAFDVLSDLRDTIHEYNHLITHKRINPGSQSIGRQTLAELTEVKSRMAMLKVHYMRSYSVLISLDCNVEKEGLHPLDESQLWGKNIWLPHVIGDSTKENPWFWSVGKPTGILEDTWLTECK